MNSSLIVICGATATGKSGLALAIAQRLNSMIISADSRQIYREFDIGTAKPTPEEQQLVPHYLIDICDPTETLTLAEYQERVQSLIHSKFDDAIARFRETPESVNNISPSPPPPLLVGGTGLYIKAIVKGLKIPRVSPQPELRASLESLGQTQIYTFLQQIDPLVAEKIHPNDSVRTLRALEVFYVTGKPISEQQGESTPAYPILQIGLSCDVATLDARIQQRTDRMMKMGFVKEVERLGAKYGWDLPLLATLGYAEIKQYLKGEITLKQAQDLTVLHTRQFAKRQRTWFRAYPEIEWFDADRSDLLETVWQRIVAFLLENQY